MIPIHIVISNHRDAPPVSTQPSVQICAWRIFETQHGQLLAGFLENGSTCRLTSPIETVNIPGREVRTHSGRRYELIGAPATDLLRLAVMAAQLKIASASNATDITDAVWVKMCAATA